MVVNFKARRISRGAHKLTQTPTLIKKKFFFSKVRSGEKTILFHK
jgi:hypothetical protein